MRWDALQQRWGRFGRCADEGGVGSTLREITLHHVFAGVVDERTFICVPGQAVASAHLCVSIRRA